MRILLVALALSLAASGAALARLPKHKLTPGVTNPDVTQDTIH